MYKKELSERFFSKIAKRDSGCWEWIGNVNKGTGYGVIDMRDRNKKGKTVRAHRVSWEIHNGEIPTGLFVCHKCDNRICTNPDHLFLGTNLDNMQDARNKGRTLKGERQHQSKLNTAEVLRIRELYKEGNSARSIWLMIKNACGYSQVLRICQNKRWRHI